ncbi:MULTISPECIES: AAA-like domain-containing protein [unclassified Microcoleus]|uniref:AAA-like domain-containing protein n=1 Tax=unclassified Microcoleus TaxID=2642155 RepID=UPI0025E8BFF4|nr:MULTISPECIES: AAA-like domain-containing protein [unclassified Microcoleus]
MMEQKDFEEKYEKLNYNQRQVLKLFLQDNSDEAIAELLHVTESDVRHHISKICQLFNFKNKPGERFPQRHKLIPLFAKYKPELVSNKLKETCGISPDNLEEVKFYYVERDCERKCYDKILEDGALIRIKAPQKMGKTLLVDRILDRASEAGYKTALLSFEDSDSEVLGDYRKLLQWLCVTLADLLDLEDKLVEHWNDTLGGINPNVTKYLERYLFKDFDQPLVLVLEKVDLVFEQATFNVDFCRLLRAWHDTAKRNDRRSAIWKKIRLIVVHATEVYSSLDINSSPLAGVGFTPPLPDFTVDEVKQLARQYRHNWLSEADIQQLMVMFGGYPYLVQTAFAYLQTSESCLTKLLEISPTAQSPFINHLRELLGKLEECPELIEVYRELVKKNQPMILKTHQTFKLESMGLLRVKNNDCFPRCDLYRQYFSQCL